MRLPSAGVMDSEFDATRAPRNERAQARKVPSSSFSAHLITSSIFSLPCVTLATITVLIA